MPVTPNPRALTTLSIVKEHLTIPDANTDYDDILQRFINTATLRIESYTDRILAQQTYTEFQDGRNSNKIVLKNYPADKPTELWIDQSSEFTDIQNQIDTTEYEIDNSQSVVVLLNGRFFVNGTQNIKIVYQAGFATIPEDIENAANWIVEWYYRMRKDKRLRSSNISKSGESETLLEDWPQWLKNQLDPYVRFQFPQANSIIINT